MINLTQQESNFKRCTNPKQVTLKPFLLLLLSKNLFYAGQIGDTQLSGAWFSVAQFTMVSFGRASGVYRAQSRRAELGKSSFGKPVQTEELN